MKWRWWRTADEMAARFVRDREGQSDRQFCTDCGLPDTTDAIRIALAVRRSVASYGMVAPEYIRAEDRYPDELISLSNWESLDILGWVLELERELGGQMVPSTAFQDLRRSFTVKELVWRVYKYLRVQPTPAGPDECAAGETSS